MDGSILIPSSMSDKAKAIIAGLVLFLTFPLLSALLFFAKSSQEDLSDGRRQECPHAWECEVHSLATGMETQFVPTLAAVAAIVIAFYIAVAAQQIRSSPTEAKSREQFGLASLMATGFLVGSFITLLLSWLINGEPSIGQLVFPAFLLGMVTFLSWRIGEFMVFDPRSRAQVAQALAADAEQRLAEHFEYASPENVRETVLERGTARRMKEQSLVPYFLGVLRQSLAVAVFSPPLVAGAALLISESDTPGNFLSRFITIYLEAITVSLGMGLLLRQCIRPMSHKTGWGKFSDMFLAVLIVLGCGLCLLVAVVALQGVARTTFVAAAAISIIIMSAHSYAASVDWEWLPQDQRSRWKPWTVGGSLWATAWFQERESLIYSMETAWLTSRKYEQMWENERGQQKDARGTTS